MHDDLTLGALEEVGDGFLAKAVFPKHGNVQVFFITRQLVPWLDVHVAFLLERGLRNATNSTIQLLPYMTSMIIT